VQPLSNQAMTATRNKNFSLPITLPWWIDASRFIANANPDLGGEGLAL
jgi:hypothetical protein